MRRARRRRRGKRDKWTPKRDASFPPRDGSMLRNSQVRLIKKYGLLVLGLAVFLPFEALLLLTLFAAVVGIIWYMVMDMI